VVLAQNYNPTATGRHWVLGDFNGSGITDFDDLLLRAQNYGLSGVALPTDLGTRVSQEFAADWAMALSMVPEPTAAAASIAGLGLVCRRR
jgi:hypothetical protein